MTPNPFKELLAGLSDTEFTTVTLDYLKHVSDTVNKPSRVIQTYGEAFQVLQFLANAKAIEMHLHEEPNVYTIRKLK